MRFANNTGTLSFYVVVFFILCGSSTQAGVSDYSFRIRGLGSGTLDITHTTATAMCFIILPTFPTLMD